MSYGTVGGTGAALGELGKGLMEYTKFNAEDMRQKNLEAIRQQERGQDNATRDRYHADDMETHKGDRAAQKELSEKQIAAAAAIAEKQQEADIVKSYGNFDSAYLAGKSKFDEQRAKIESDQNITDPAERDRQLSAVDAREKNLLVAITNQKQAFQKQFGKVLKSWGQFIDTEEAPPAATPAPGVGDGSFLTAPVVDGAAPAAANPEVQSRVDALSSPTGLAAPKGATAQSLGLDDKVASAAADLGLTTARTTGEIASEAGKSVVRTVAGGAKAAAGTVADTARALKAGVLRSQASGDIRNAMTPDGNINKPRIARLAQSGLDSDTLRSLGASDKIIALVEKVRGM